ncbi:PilN domain-containing protein [Vallitalea okinawensis]|uniref:PilN domain-containing protein n=1 Tax=Vallitalea okinawensis TaxID=2078660 RepID=UPI000CFDECB7|nr:PilN domain-containing protein [Vallitalea okinawensis]
MTDINLLYTIKEKLNAKRRDKTKSFLLALPILLVFAITAIMYISYVMQTSTYEEKRIAIEVDQNTVAQINEIKTEITDLQDLKIIYESLKNANGSISQITLFDDLKLLFPEGVFILSYTVNDQGDCTMSGEADDEESVAYLINNLKTYKSFYQIEVSSITVNEEGKSSFSLTFKIEGESNGA